MRNFILFREKDISNISGIGIVAEGTEFTDGSVALRWVVGDHRSTSTWNSMEDVKEIHGHSGATLIIYCGVAYSLEEVKNLLLKIVSVYSTFKAQEIYKLASTIFPEFLLKSAIKELTLENKLTYDWNGNYTRINK